MTTIWEAYELHCVNQKHDKFYRIIRSGATVVIRFGRRGSNGQRQVKNLDVGTAAELIHDQRIDKVYRGDYHEVYRDLPVTTLDGSLLKGDLGPSPQATTPDEIEQVFMARWHNKALYGISGEPRFWVLYTGLLAASKVNPTGKFTLEALCGKTHAIDRHRDLVLGSVYDHDEVGQTTNYLDYDPVCVGIVEEGDSTDVLTTTLGLYVPREGDMATFMKVARRLVQAAEPKVSA